ncbi:hypothetical protein CEUSTIGMA_g6559.t1 [Chlamydomonas eustigma]|uniref:tRNA/rRNA methyltransferase SpoU type domain-containing protein n=1 Tax=Chlamydomonas eustigma TaxID=1157962 RepID=A0A250X866_9CHLO|nr:hypothetical protein CEUSTIGMA_g6559.t1 [Chlamydomonas eustigma]|eukprot:GAX79119.1 hypothetical protein CEUSTIGMA_g6559.t1 [Chlamydomonas eustigma]
MSCAGRLVNIKGLPSLCLSWRPRSSINHRLFASIRRNAEHPIFETPSETAPEIPSTSYITSTSNDYVKHCAKLLVNSKYRSEVRRFLLIGQELISEAVGDNVQTKLKIRVLFLKEGTFQVQHSAKGGSLSERFQGQARSRSEGPKAAKGQVQKRVTATLDSGVRNSGMNMSWLQHLSVGATLTVSESVMKKLTGLESVADIHAVAELDLPQVEDFKTAEYKVDRLLALDRIQDPGNLGTLLRTAMALGWDGVFLLPGCTDPFSDKAVRASRGASIRTRIGRGSLEELKSVVSAQGLKLLAAEPDPVMPDVGTSQSSSSMRAVPSVAEAAGGPNSRSNRKRRLWEDPAESSESIYDVASGPAPANSKDETLRHDIDSAGSSSSSRGSALLFASQVGGKEHNTLDNTTDLNSPAGSSSTQQSGGSSRSLEKEVSNKQMSQTGRGVQDVGAERVMDVTSQHGLISGTRQLSAGVCLVLGNEGQGLSPEVLSQCIPVAIPMPGMKVTPSRVAVSKEMDTRSMESLNVGVAGGILMFMLSSGMPKLVTRLEALLTPAACSTTKE